VLSGFALLIFLYLLVFENHDKNSMLTEAYCARFEIVGRRPTTKKTSIEGLRLRFASRRVVPGHRTGEPEFATLKSASADDYVYADVGIKRKPRAF
jgi:hypothetical protein